MNQHQELKDVKDIYMHIVFLENYNHRLETIRQELVSKQNEYNKVLQDGVGTPKVINNLKFEIARMQNLYDYGKDIITNTEKMSLNKNVLRKHYYIIIPYYEAELGVSFTDEEEKRNMIFAEQNENFIKTFIPPDKEKGTLLLSKFIDYSAKYDDEIGVYAVDEGSCKPIKDKEMGMINQNLWFICLLDVIFNT